MPEEATEAEADGADAQDGAEQEEETEREPTKAERIAAVDVTDELREAVEDDDAEVSEIERKAVRRDRLLDDHGKDLDELADDEATRDELQRLYNEEGLSLVDIGLMYGSTDATIQRRMEQHGLERRGNRAEISRDSLVDAYLDLACEQAQADDVGELAGAVEAGEFELPTTTDMTNEGPHSAHTYYNYWDSWDDLVAAILDEIGAEYPEEEAPEDGDDGDEE